MAQVWPPPWVAICSYHALMHEGEAVKPVESAGEGGIPKFCRGCHYPLRGLEIVGSCPECAQSYDLGNHTTYTYDAKPVPLWRKLARSQKRLLVLALFLALGHGILVAATYGCVVLLLLPIWVSALCFFLMDSVYRMLNLQVGFASMVIGFALGAGIYAAMSLIYDFEFSIFIALFSGGFGGLGGILLVYAEISNLRNG